MEKIIIDSRLDVLVVNDLQKDFLENFSQTESEIISQRLISIIPFFSLNNTLFLLHGHELKTFKENPNLRHCVIYPKIPVTTSQKKEISEIGASVGFEFEKNLSIYLDKELAKGHPVKRFYKLDCPLLGSQFSALQACGIDSMLLKANIRRIFFAGIHLNPCIRNEIYYLNRKNNFEIFVIKDLIGLADAREKMALLAALRSDGIKCINSDQLFK